MTIENPKGLPQNWKLQPKRNLEIPIIDQDRLASAYPDLVSETDRLYSFLECPLITDEHQDNHRERREAELHTFSKLEEDFGTDTTEFVIQLVNTNQLGKNTLLSVVNTFNTIAKILFKKHGLTTVSEEVKTLETQLRIRLAGGNLNDQVFDPYTQLKTTDQKIAVVEHFQDQVVLILNRINHLVSD